MTRSPRASASPTATSAAGSGGAAGTPRRRPRPALVSIRSWAATRKARCCRGGGEEIVAGSLPVTRETGHTQQQHDKNNIINKQPHERTRLAHTQQRSKVARRRCVPPPAFFKKVRVKSHVVDCELTQSVHQSPRPALASIRSWVATRQARCCRGGGEEIVADPFSVHTLESISIYISIYIYIYISIYIYI